MPDRCTDPTCLEHWPALWEQGWQGYSMPVHLTLHTAPTPPIEVSTGYPRRDITWTKGEAEALTSWSTFTIGAGEDDPDDELPA